jgi:hypothetical protein
MQALSQLSYTPVTYKNFLSICYFQASNYSVKN